MGKKNARLRGKSDTDAFSLPDSEMFLFSES